MYGFAALPTSKKVSRESACILRSRLRGRSCCWVVYHSEWPIIKRVHQDLWLACDYLFVRMDVRHQQHLKPLWSWRTCVFRGHGLERICWGKLERGRVWGSIQAWWYIFPETRLRKREVAVQAFRFKSQSFRFCRNGRQALVRKAKERTVGPWTYRKDERIVWLMTRVSFINIYSI